MPRDLFIPECLINKLNYGVLYQLPATSGHIKSKTANIHFKDCCLQTSDSHYKTDVRTNMNGSELGTSQDFLVKFDIALIKG